MRASASRETLCAMPDNPETILPAAYVSVDPGAHGAVAYFAPTFVGVAPLPKVVTRTSRGRARVRTCPVGMSHALRFYADLGARYLVRENVWGVAGQGAGGAAALGYSLGVIDAASAAAGLQLVSVSPVKWKHGMGLLGKDKNASAALAREMFGPLPFMTIRGQRNGAAVEGMAEAALIGAWFARHGVAPC